MKNCACCGRQFTHRAVGGGVARVVHTGNYEVTAPAAKVKFDLMVRLEAPKGTRVCESCLHQSLIVSLAGLQARLETPKADPVEGLLPCGIVLPPLPGPTVAPEGDAR